MIKYRLVLSVLFYFLTAASVRSQTTDTIEHSSDTASYFVAPLTQNMSIPEQLRTVPKQQIDKYLKDPAYAYANDSDYWRSDPTRQTGPGPVSRFLSGKIFQWTFFLAIVSIVLFGLYRLVLENNIGGFFSRWTRSAKANAGETSYEEVEDFDMFISKYQSEGNYRTAVRYLYLRLIRTAIENRDIHVGDSSTNAVIAKSFSNQKESADFQYLASAFEYVFYGGFSPAVHVYENLKSKFDRFQETLLN